MFPCGERTGISATDVAAATPPIADPTILVHLSSSGRSRTTLAAADPPLNPAEILPHRMPTALAALVPSAHGTFFLP